ncbi:hypothetical protein BDV06DRAFT_222592 [Aspergillus oleicola]
MESSLETRTCLPATYLNETQLQNTGEFIITCCDILEEYGLVDYELGIWEEEILDVLGKCIDLSCEFVDGTVPSSRER